MSVDLRALPRIELVELEPVFVSAQLHLNWEDQPVVRTARDYIFGCPLRVVHKSCVVLACRKVCHRAKANCELPALLLMQRLVLRPKVIGVVDL